MSPNTSRPRVSVGMPIYNREKYVAASIEAHLDQTYTDFELIVTDNASTDRSGEICRAYAAKDPRVKYFLNDRNFGASANYSRAFELSTGEFFRWSPSDDLVSLNLLECAVSVLDGDASVFVAYPRTRLIDTDGRITGDFDEHLHTMDERPSKRWRHTAEHLRLGNLHYGLSRASTLRKTGLLRNYSGGDFPLILEMSLYGKFYEIPDAYFYRRMHAEASSALKENSDLMAFYSPSKRDRLFLYNWTHWGANLKSIGRAPIPMVEKVHLYSYELHRLIWSRKDFVGDLRSAAYYAKRKITR